MGRRGLSILAFTAVLGLASNTDARGLLGGARIVLKAGRLADSLRDLSVRSGSDLLFAPDVVGNLHNKRVVGTLEVEQILTRLLEGTGLGYRRVGAGSYIVFRLEVEQPTAVPELLVVGRKTQNADIRRTENDIQGYRVAGAEDIRSSHADNLDQFMRSRQTNNAERLGPSSDPRQQYASNRSELDFHGLGPSQTLVLIDGARMPSTLSQFFSLELGQPDVNGLPLLAIDRIESLTGTAGGIYGPGATGGVVNVVLKRDYRGAEVSATYGLTGRGDGGRRRVDARIGFTPDDGATDVMINVSRAEGAGLRFGDRGLAERALQAQIARGDTNASSLVLGGVMVHSLNGSVLSLSPALGGASLGSSFTYLPLGTSGVGDGSILLANAGKIPDQLAPDGNGDLRSLTSSTTVTSLLLNARHRFGDHVEAVLDFIGWENEGRSASAFLITAFTTGMTQPRGGVASGLPFNQLVSISFPFPGMETQVRNRMRTTRASAKLIFDLPAAWRGETTYSAGATRNRVREDGWMFDQNFPRSLNFIQPGAGGEPTPRPFGPWDDFVATMQIYKIPNKVRFERKLHLRDLAVRLGGPVVRRAAGDVSLSLLAERREEKATITPWDENGSSNIPPGGNPSFSVTTTSLYGELRAPIIPRASSLTPLRGLELQLAARYDANQADIPARQFLSPRSQYDRAAAVYTAGLRVFPLERLLVRASVATGVLPPTPEQMSEGQFTTTPGDGYFYRTPDPARGGEMVGSRNAVLVLTDGSTRLRPERARTVALGFVLNPEGGRGPRVSLDYTHTEKHGEIGTLGGSTYFLEHEALYPDRIVRDPLTPADIAAGYSGGVITRIDATNVNIGRTVVDAVDLHVDQGFRLGPDSRLRLFGGVTWTPRLTRRIATDTPVIDYIDTNDGPLRWRGSAGAAWEHGDFSVRLDAQYYGDYVAVTAPYANMKTVDLTPGQVPAQVYLDAAMTYRLQVGGLQPLARDVEIRFGIQNLLDSAPPIDNSEFGYSLYGDPRGRRFEISATARF